MFLLGGMNSKEMQELGTRKTVRNNEVSVSMKRVSVKRGSSQCVPILNHCACKC